MTHLMQIKSIPKAIKFDGELEVRGEVYMPRESFLKLLKRQELMGEALAKNPRNAAAGSLRQKNSKLLPRENSVFLFSIFKELLARNFLPTLKPWIS